MAKTKSSASAAWLLRHSGPAPPPPQKKKLKSEVRLPFTFFDCSVQRGEKPDREVLVMDTNQKTVWTTEKLMGRDMWIEWVEFQVTQAALISKRGNGTTQSRAAARELRNRQVHGPSALDEIEDVD